MCLGARHLFSQTRVIETEAEAKLSRPFLSARLRWFSRGLALTVVGLPTRKLRSCLPGRADCACVI